MSFAKLVLVSLVVGVVGCGAIWITPVWFTEPASVEADRHDILYTSLMLVSAIIMGIVVTFLGYCMWKFRYRKGEPLRDGAPIHGHTRLEIGWTLLPLVIVIAFSVYGAVVLAQNEARADDRFTVDVTARQFAWAFGYPELGVEASPVLVLPEGRQAEFHIRALDDDVIHSFYVPEFRMQANAVPGQMVRTWATPDRVGTYSVICLELCGLGHAQMRALVRVVPPDEFDAWIEEQRANPAPNPLGQVQQQSGEGGE